MTYQDRYNSERYLDMTAYFAMKNIERKEGVKTGMREDWDFRRGDLYLADLGYGAVGYDGSHVQGGVRPVVIVQNDRGNRFSPTVICAAMTSRLGKSDLPTHVWVSARDSGLKSDSLVLCEQIRTIEKKRLKGRAGRIAGLALARVDEALLAAMGIRRE